MSSSGAVATGTMFQTVAQVTDRRYFPQAASTAPPGTNGALTNGTLRVSPGFVPSPITISQLGGDVSIIGDVGSTLLIVVYRDLGSGGFLYPGALESSGAILGDSATVQEVDVTDFTLGVGWHWFGAVVQGVTVTQPTVRSVGGSGIVGIVNGLIPGAGNSFLGYTAAGVTGAAPANFPAFSNNVTGTMPRVHLRLA